MKKHLSFISIPHVLALFIVGVSSYFLYYKFQLGMIRYFDVDEYAYLWWASHMHQGLLPYRDFFFYGTPGFVWLLTALFSFVSGITAFIASRYLMFIVFLFLLLAAILLFWQMRKSWIALFFPVFLLFLPLPSDKFLEVRPDTVAMTVFLFGLALQIKGMNEQAKHRSHFFISGLFYAYALVVSQKMLIPVAISGLGFIGWGVTMVAIRKQWYHACISLFLGAVSVCIVTVLWLASIGNWPLVWYSLTTLPFEVSNLGFLFPIPPSFFFFPNDVVYGTPGYHSGYWLNLLFWTTGILIGGFRLVTPYVTNGKKGVWQEMIVSAVFYVSFIFFIWGTPIKNPQYFIPVSVFVCFYVADGVWMLWNATGSSLGKQWIFFSGSIVFLSAMIVGFINVTQPKLVWTNEYALMTAEKIFATIPTTEPILDLEGLTVYYPQSYYLSCLPIGQIVPLMSMPLPSLSTQLELTDTKYIYQGGSKRLTTLSGEDQAYIHTHFVEVGDGGLLVRNDILFSYDKRISK